MSVQAICEDAGIHWRHWQKFEAGEANATLKSLAKLAEALGVPAHELLTPPT